MLNLHAKFMAENPDEKISYTKFSQLRPFNVVKSPANQRDAMKCRIHQNFELKALALHSRDIIKSKDTY